MKSKLFLGSMLLTGISTFGQINQNTSGQTGVGTNAPANRLEVKSAATDPYGAVISTNGASGLRLTNLTSSKTPLTNPSGNVLSVDGNGDVILVPDHAGSGTFGGAQNGCSANSSVVELGNVWGATTANLLNNREIPQNNNRLLFSGNQANDLLKIGGSSGSTISNSRVYIESHKPLNQTYAQFPGLHITSDADANENIGALIQIQDKNSSTFAPVNKGISVYSTGAGDQYGAYINSVCNANSTRPKSYGAYIYANAQSSSTEPRGLEAQVAANGATNSYGIFALTTGASVDNIGGYFAADGNNSTFVNARNTGVMALAQNVLGNARGVSTSVGPSNSAINPNSIHTGVDIIVSTGSNVTPITNLTQYGIKSDVRNLGIIPGASSSGKLYGVYSRAWNESQPGSTGFMNFGVYATAETSKTIDGSVGTQSNIAIFASTRQFNTNPSVQTVGKNSWAGWFDGDVYIGGSGGVGGGGFYNGSGAPPAANPVLVINGDAFSNGTVWSTSDRRYKQEINSLTDVTSKIKKLSGYSYKFKTEEFPDKNFAKSQQIGLIAQELQEVFPQLVNEDKQGYLSVNYQGMIPVLLEAIKEQQQQIDELKEQNLSMQQKLNTAAGIEDLTIQSGFQMSQNEPNPFTHETVVKYTLPANVNNAFMAVYDLTGKQVTTFPINQKGASFITITSEKLSPGIYIYSVVADGKVMDSKRMIVADK